VSDAPDDPNDSALHAIEQHLALRWGESQVKPSLAREAELMDLLGSPQLSAPVVHIAGTNGKTSTTRMIESLLRAAGLRTGMFTSPHLHSLLERISVDGASIDDDTFVRVYQEIAPFIELVDDSVGTMTWFEVMTGVAFACFADAPVEAMVIECGLGGTWDSTNVVEPATCVITPIGMDHQDYLGDTLDQIAGEKAGIITAAVPVVMSAQHAEAAEVITTRAREVGAQLLIAERDFRTIGRSLAVGGQVIDVEGVAGLYEDVFIPLHGHHQADNAAAAIAATEVFLGGRGLDADLVREAFAGAHSPGRLEVLRHSPTVVADAAHNPQGMRSLVAGLDEVFQFPKIVAVVAIFEDKDISEMLSELSKVAEEIVVTRNSSPRSMPVDDLADLARGIWDDHMISVEPRMSDALERAVAIADGEPPGAVGVVVTGSVTTVADARLLLGRA
jgi:dihydrofolate synthase / folylpolyglutamate synthase